MRATTFEAWTVALIKPDAVRRQLVGTIVAEMESRGFVILRMRRVLIIQHAVAPALYDRARVGQFYQEHRSRPYFDALVDFMCSGDFYAVKLAGSESVIADWRTAMGPSAPDKRGPFTIRGRYATGCPEMENLVHGSDSEAAAVREYEVLSQWGVL